MHNCLIKGYLFYCQSVFPQRYHFLSFIAGKSPSKHFHSEQWIITRSFSDHIIYLTCRKTISHVDPNYVLKKPSWLIHVTTLTMFVSHLTLVEVFVTGITSDTVECIERPQVYDMLSMTLIQRKISLSPWSFTNQSISLGGEYCIFVIISRLSLFFALHFIPYLSFDVICFVNNHPKRGRLLVQYLPTLCFGDCW